MDLSEVSLNPGGAWHFSAYPGRADLLLAALDPTAAYVLIETYDGVHGWHEAFVSISPTEPPKRRLVRRLAFELLVDPTEAAEIGSHLHETGRGFMMYQFRQQPRADFHLPDCPKGRADAMRGHGVELSIDLPHDGEVAVVASPRKSAADDYRRRLS